MKTWCNRHYLETVRKSIENYNALQYHYCCNSFSRRSYAKRAGHPSIHTANILKIPSLKAVSSADELYHWLRMRMREHQSEGRPAFFPGINRPHQVIPVDNNHNDGECFKADFFKTRCESLLKENEDFVQKLEKLKEDNMKLQSSSKYWMRLYQDAVIREMDSDHGEYKPLDWPKPIRTSTPNKKSHPFLNLPEEL